MRSAYAYRFETNWTFEADKGQVWALISGVDYGAWWHGVSTELISKSGSPDGIGNKYEFVVRTKLPYKLKFVTEIMAARVPDYLATRATGDLEGRGIWSLKQEGRLTRVRFLWRVNAHKKWMQAQEGLRMH
jgi:hypothetical protein